MTFVSSNPTNIITQSSGGGGAPTWFVGLAEKTWTVIAKGTGSDFTSGATLASTNPNTVGIDGTSGFRGMITAWCGASANQDQKELLLAGNGGHGDYLGNGGYALQLNRSIPRWFRLADPSPTSAWATNPPCNVYGLNPAVYADGRPASMHTANTPTYGNGKVYIMGQTAYSNIGGGSPAIFSFDRAGLGTNPSSPLAYAGGTGPWTHHGSGSTTQSSNFSCACFDPVTNLAWGFFKTQNYDASWFSIDAAGTITRYTQSSGVGGIATLQQRSWAVCCDDLGLFVIGNGLDNGVTDTQLGIVTRATPNSMTIKNTVQAYNMGAWGAVYHKPSRSILTYQSSVHTNGQMLKLKIPISAPGVPDMAAPWNWVQVDKATGSISPTHEYGDFVGTYSKFNIINDMGNGQACLVYVTGINNGYTYVYKLPVGEVS